MPVYEYHCQKCGEEFEILVLAAADGSRCPVCGGNDLKRKFSVFGMKSGSGSVSKSGCSCSGCSSHSCSGCSH